jgi:single-stranded-DNA-specific exonuclease
MKDWLEPSEIDVSADFQAAIGGHPLVARTLARRGLSSLEAARAFLDPQRYEPAPPAELPDLTRAAERVQAAVRNGERVCVWGDFDVDGQTATTTLLSTLRDLGAAVTYHIPIRQQEARGLGLAALDKLIDEGVRLVLTCDTGVTAHEAIDYARSRGVDVVVTDHHDLPPVLPEACAVVNPKRLPEAHPLRELPGVGCAYKLAEALYDRTGRADDAARHLDLVALGIVADAAVQTGDTRHLLQRGLEKLRHTDRLGLRTMMEIAELSPERLTEEHVGYVLGPRLNALGRLADASVAVELLTTRDLARARILATELEGLNARRRLLCDQVTQAAQGLIERDSSLLEHAVLVLSHPSWPAGVLGIVASRLAEQYQRPAILIAAPPGKLGHGSARSIEGCNITAAIAAHRELLARFGGHPMAAGLSIEPERIPEFRVALSRTVLEMCGEPGARAALQIDGYLSLGDLGLDLVEELERLAPFGPGNPPLTLVSSRLKLQSHTPVGRNGEHLQLIVEDEAGVTQRAIWWQGAGGSLPEGRFDLAYVVRASDYRGQRDVQVEWVDARPAEEPAAAVRAAPAIADVRDHRASSDPRRLLERLRSSEDVLVWSEAEARAAVAGRDRYELAPSKTLVIWTTPPGPDELGEALRRVSPETVHLVGIDPGLDKLESFVERLAGLVKRALSSSGGRVHLSTLAAGTAQREGTVRAGVAWLVARGHVLVLAEEAGEIHLAVGGGRAGSELPRATARLEALLAETGAYRRHFAHADADTLIPAAS